MSNDKPYPTLLCLDCIYDKCCRHQNEYSLRVVTEWLENKEITGCEFHQPEFYHGLEGCKK